MWIFLITYNFYYTIATVLHNAKGSYTTIIIIQCLIDCVVVYEQPDRCVYADQFRFQHVSHLY